MSIERAAAYYDEIYGTSEMYELAYTDMPYYTLWKKVIELIPENMEVVDVGCGCGQFGRMLIDTKPPAMYSGLDFSGIAVDKAWKLIPEYYPAIRCMSLYDARITHGQIVVSLEVFEHIDDYRFINQIPLGNEVVFTVPDFNDAAHVRYFKSIAEIIHRYQNVLNFSHIEKFERWFVCKAVRV